MSDASILSAEIQDLAAAVSEVNKSIIVSADKIAKEKPAEVPEPMLGIQLPAPVFHINVPEQKAPDVVVNVPQQAPAKINVEAPNVSIAPQINIPECVPFAYRVQIIKRDAGGSIQEFTISPIL